MVRLFLFFWVHHFVFHGANRTVLHFTVCAWVWQFYPIVSKLCYWFEFPWQWAALGTFSYTACLCLLWNVQLRCLPMCFIMWCCTGWAGDYMLNSWSQGTLPAQFSKKLLNFLRSWDHSTGPVQYNFGCGFGGVGWRWESGSLCAAQTGLQLSVCLSIPSAGITGMPADPAPFRFMLVCLFFCWIVGVLCSLFPSRVEAELR